LKVKVLANHIAHSNIACIHNVTQLVTFTLYNDIQKHLNLFGSW